MPTTIGPPTKQAGTLYSILSKSDEGCHGDVFVGKKHRKHMASLYGRIGNTLGAITLIGVNQNSGLVFIHSACSYTNHGLKCFPEFCELHKYSETSELRTPQDHVEVSVIGRCPLYRTHSVMWWPFPVSVFHVFESLARTLSAEKLSNVEEWIETASLQEQQIFYNSFVTVSRDCPLSEEICIDFVRWGVTSVSVIQGREVSTIRRSLCTVNYREWFGTVASCPHYGGSVIGESVVGGSTVFITYSPIFSQVCGLCGFVT